jgi:hypothetical protein
MKVSIEPRDQTDSLPDRFTLEKDTYYVGGLVDLKRQSGQQGETKNPWSRGESNPDFPVVQSVA